MWTDDDFGATSISLLDSELSNGMDDTFWNTIEPDPYFLASPDDLSSIFDIPSEGMEYPFATQAEYRVALELPPQT